MRYVGVLSLPFPCSCSSSLCSNWNFPRSVNLKLLLSADILPLIFSCSTCSVSLWSFLGNDRDHQVGQLTGWPQKGSICAVSYAGPTFSSASHDIMTRGTNLKHLQLFRMLMQIEFNFQWGAICRSYGLSRCISASGNVEPDKGASCSYLVQFASL